METETGPDGGSFHANVTFPCSLEASAWFFLPAPDRSHLCGCVDGGFELEQLSDDLHVTLFGGQMESIQAVLRERRRFSEPRRGRGNSTLTQIT